MGKSQKQIDEILESARKEKGNASQITENTIREILFIIFEQRKLAKNELNIQYALKRAAYYSNGKKNISALPSFLTAVVLIDYDNFQKLHHDTPLFRALNPK